MKVAFTLSQNITLMYCTIRKIVLICYTILFWDTQYIQHFTNTWVVMSCEINACSIFVLRRISVCTCLCGTTPARSIDRKRRWCNITIKVLVSCRIAINVYSLKSAYHNSRRWFVLLQILRGWLIWFPFNENIKMYTTVVHHTWYPRSYVQILFTVNAINMGYT